MREAAESKHRIITRTISTSHLYSSTEAREEEEAGRDQMRIGWR